MTSSEETAKLINALTAQVKANTALYLAELARANNALKQLQGKLLEM